MAWRSELTTAFSIFTSNSQVANQQNITAEWRDIDDANYLIDSDGRCLASVESDVITTYEERAARTIDGAAGVKATPTSALWHIMAGGQSLSVAGGRDGIVGAQDREFSIGRRIATTDTGSTLVPMSPEHDFFGVVAGAISQMRYLMAQEAGTGDDVAFLLSGYGVNGQSITAFEPGDPGDEYWQDAIHQIDEGIRLGGADYSLAAHMWVQGEADRNRAFADYKARSIALFESYRDHALGEGQAFTPIHFLYQNASEHYDHTGRRDPVVARTNYELDAERDDCVLTVPLYWLLHSDNVHLTNETYGVFGGYMGKAMYKRLFLGEDWTCLRPTAVETTTGGVLVTFKGVVNGLSFDDTTVSDPGDYGFRIIDDQGEVTQTAPPEIVGTNQVKLTATIDLGENPLVQYAWDIVGPHEVTGKTDGPRGCLRDNDPTLWHFDKTTPLNNWAVRFSEAVTS